MVDIADQVLSFLQSGPASLVDIDNFLNRDKSNVTKIDLSEILHVILVLWKDKKIRIVGQDKGIHFNTIYEVV